MSFWEKIKVGFQKFMTGRSGADELSLALLIFALLVSILASFTGSALFAILNIAAYVLCIYRMFSRNVVRRRTENQKFISGWHSAKRFASQSWVRVKNMRKYKYFKCPECHARLRLPRKVGEVTITCGKCKHAFKKKA